jgi:glucose/mannose-6-phosphate isomerase
MNLDDTNGFKQLDPQNMLAEIDALPAQLESAWHLGQTLPLPKMKAIRQIIISGMGGSAIGADLLTAYISKTCSVPVIVHRDYGLPAWASQTGTLVIAASHSGDTEETLDSFASALKSDCRVMVVCTGGELERCARSAGVPAWKFVHAGQPRAAVGF